MRAMLWGPLKEAFVGSLWQEQCVVAGRPMGALQITAS